MEIEPKQKETTPTAHSAIYILPRARAMQKVAKEMGIAFERKGAGHKYGDHTIEKGFAYVSVDPGTKTEEFWEKVNQLAPPPTLGQAEGKEKYRT